MDHVTRLRQIAAELELVDEEGRLKELDSLGIVRFVVRIEDELRRSIPVEVITQEAFASFEALAAVLQSSALDAKGNG